MKCAEKLTTAFDFRARRHGMVSLGVASDLMVFGKEVLRSVSQAGETDMVFHNVRTLVLHGGADGVVDVRGSRSLVDAITKVGKTEATLIELDGAFHEAHNEKSNMGGDDFRHHASNFLTGCFEAASDLKLPEDEDE